MPQQMKNALAAVAVLITVGCETVYVPVGVEGGYSESQLEENTYRVVFTGNEYTSKETIFRHWFHRCAELTLEKGFDYFVILDAPTHGAGAHPSEVEAVEEIAGAEYFVKTKGTGMSGGKAGVGGNMGSGPQSGSGAGSSGKGGSGSSMGGRYPSTRYSAFSREIRMFKGELPQGLRMGFVARNVIRGKVSYAALKDMIWINP